MSNASSPPLLRRLLPALILLAAVALTVLLVKTRAQPEPQTAETRRWTVTAAVLEPITTAPELALYGQVEIPQLTRISSALNADVAQILVTEGESVAAGQVLLQLDQREIKLQMRQREADLRAIEARIAAELNRHRTDLEALRLEQAVQNLNQQKVTRAQELKGRSLLSQEQLDNAHLTTRQQALAISARTQAIADHPNRLTQLQAEQSRLEALADSSRLDLERSQVTAPFNARIVTLESATGNRVRSGDPLLTLYNIDRLQLRAQLPDRWLGFLDDPQQYGQLTAVAEREGRPIPLQLKQLAARISTGQTGVDALFSFLDPQTAPLPGRTLSLRLKLPAQPGLYALPPEALYGSNRVYRISTDERLEAVEVQHLGQHTPVEGPQQILLASAHLKAGDRLITTQLPNAIGGLAIQVVE